MPRTLVLFLVAFAFPLLPGCVFSNRQTNHPLDPAAFARLEPGRSTAKDVLEILGAPTEVVQLGTWSAYRYDHTRTKEAGLWLVVVFLHGSDVQSDRAWLFFNANDLLMDFGTTFDADRARYAIPPMKTSGE